MKIKFFKENVKLPAKSHLPDSGLDLFMPEAFTIKPLETKTIGLGLAVAIPEGTAGILIPRSSIAQKGLIIQTSAIDPDYQAEIHLIITNCSDKTYTFKKDSRVCSLVCVNILNPYIEVVDSLGEPSNRGNNGLGSTGV